MDADRVQNGLLCGIDRRLGSGQSFRAAGPAVPMVRPFSFADPMPCRDFFQLSIDARMP